MLGGIPMVVVAVWLAGVFLFWLNFNQNYVGNRHGTFTNGCWLIAGIGTFVISLTVLYLASASSTDEQQASVSTSQASRRSEATTTRVQAAVQPEAWWEDARKG